MLDSNIAHSGDKTTVVSETSEKLTASAQAQPGEKAPDNSVASADMVKAGTLPSLTIAGAGTESATKGGAGAVAKDLGEGAWNEVTEHPGRVLGTAALGLGIGVAVAAAAPEVAIGAAAVGIGYAGYELYEHLGGWLNDAKVVDNPDGYSKDQVAQADNGLKQVGAGGVDVAAGTVGALGGGALVGLLSAGDGAAVSSTSAADSGVGSGAPVEQTGAPDINLGNPNPAASSGLETAGANGPNPASIGDGAPATGDGAAAANAPAAANASADAPAATSPAADAPAVTSPAGDAPAATSPAGDAPAAASPAGDAPAATSPAGDAPAAANPASDAPANSAGQTDTNTAADKPAANNDAQTAEKLTPAEQQLADSIKGNQALFNQANQDGNVITAVKQDYNVSFQRVDQPTEIQTLEGLKTGTTQTVPAGNYIATRLNPDGTPNMEQGIQNSWSIAPNKVLKTYAATPEDLNQSSFVAATRTDAPPVHMVKLTAPTTITTPWGQMSGDTGSYLANYDYNAATNTPGSDYAIVTDASYNQTYKSI